MAAASDSFDLNFDWDFTELDLTPVESKDIFDDPAAAPAPKKRRFSAVSDSDVTKLLKDSENKNTIKKTASDVRLLRKFINEQYPEFQNTDLSDIDHDGLCDMLCKFLTVAKREDGSDYEPSTIRGIIASIDRHLSSKGRMRIATATDAKSKRVQDVLNSKLKTLKKGGKGNLPNKADPLGDDDVDTLWSSGQLGTQTPKTILNSLWWNNTLHFGMRSVAPHRAMCWGDIQLKTNANGRRYLEYNERATKTRTGVNVKRDSNPRAKAFENEEDPGRCPVQIYLKYAALRPENAQTPDSPFYLACSTRPGGPVDGQWFKNQPVGINTLGSLMKTMSAAAGLGDGKKISNHSARKTMVQKLNDHGLPPTHIMQVSGHRNVQSINNYSTMSDTQRQHVSKILNATSTVTHTLSAQQVENLSGVPSRSAAMIGSHNQVTSSSATDRSTGVHFDAPIYGGVFNFSFNV
ncbi:hypothetical protein V1264_014276 [Littorina saxatilis]|uniref:ZMYM2-like/QRICH1 C-terminal domain-containing protein n=1 Tax=Littorina saxatilis TaxID=31220 RepID=A0AAN9BQS4_9CAEN